MPNQGLSETGPFVDFVNETTQITGASDVTWLAIRVGFMVETTTTRGPARPVTVTPVAGPRGSLSQLRWRRPSTRREVMTPGDMGKRMEKGRDNRITPKLCQFHGDPMAVNESWAFEYPTESRILRQAHWRRLEQIKAHENFCFFWEKTRLILIHSTCKLDFSWFSESIVSFVLVMWKPNSGTYFGHIAIACFR